MTSPITVTARVVTTRATSTRSTGRLTAAARGVVITGAAPQDRISAVTPLPSPALSATLLAARTVPAGVSRGGWLYDLLTRAGVDPSTARSLVEFVIRPLEILIVVAVAALVAHYGARAIRRVFGRMARRAVDRSDSPRAGARMTTVVALTSTVWRVF